MHLNTINTLLNKADLGVPTNPDLISLLISKNSPKLLSDALHRAANNDLGAKMWVTTAINKVRSTQGRPTLPLQPNHSDAPFRERDFIGHHVYGSKFAIHMAIDKTRGGVHTVRLEGAQSVGQRKYDWNKKISIQITQQELPHVACVLFGWINQCEYKNHGPKKDKGFKLIV